MLPDFLDCFVDLDREFELQPVETLVAVLLVAVVVDKDSHYADLSAHRPILTSILSLDLCFFAKTTAVQCMRSRAHRVDFR